MKKSNVKRTAIVIAGLLIAVLLFTGIEFALRMQIEPIPDLPAQPLDGEGLSEVLFLYAQGDQQAKLTEQYVNDAIAPSITYVNNRYDCSDFRVNTLVRLYLGYENQLHDSTKQTIEQTLLHFKYWMDQSQPGVPSNDSMCYWSENHQILFAANEYLVGTKWPDATFAVDGKTGAAHATMAKARINAWMDQRFHYGFNEFYSNNYYPEDIAGMSNFLEFAKDDAMRNRMTMVMDILWFDLASQSNRYLSPDNKTYHIFLSGSGRMYADNKASDDTGNRLRSYIDFVVQPDAAPEWQANHGGFFSSFRLMVAHGFYQVPEVILSIFRDDARPTVVKSSQSLDASELAGERLLGQSDAQIMMQLGMEAFTNPDVIANTLAYLSKNNMYHNMFVNDFKMVNLSLLTKTGLIKPLSTLLNPATNGVAIQRGNVYTYKTNRYAMSTVQNYHPGDFGDQQHLFTANLSNDLSVFVTQPARKPSRSSSPNYWVGNGRNPASIQEKNVNISIYDVPTKPAMMEPHVVPFTHAYFPTQLFDQVDESKLDKGYVFGRKGDAYVALIANGALAFESLDENYTKINKNLSDRYDLILKKPGYHTWITELSSREEDGSFEAFVERVLANPVAFAEQKATYGTRIGTLENVFGKACSLDGIPIVTDYARYENAYVPGGVTARKADVIAYVFGEHSLTLRWQENQRIAQ